MPVIVITCYLTKPIIYTLNFNEWLNSISYNLFDSVNLPDFSSRIWFAIFSNWRWDDFCISIISSFWVESFSVKAELLAAKVLLFELIFVNFSVKEQFFLQILLKYSYDLLAVQLDIPDLLSIEEVFLFNLLIIVFCFIDFLNL